MTAKQSDWIEKENADQCKWAFQYLSKKNLISTTKSISDYKAVTSLLATWPDDAEHREKLTQMKRAWKTQANRVKQQGDCTPCNFVLPVSVKKHLDTLAAQRGLTLNRTIEALIEESFNLSTQANAEAENPNSSLTHNSSLSEDGCGLKDTETEKTTNSITKTASPSIQLYPLKRSVQVKAHPTRYRVTGRK